MSPAELRQSFSLPSRDAFSLHPQEDRAAQPHVPQCEIVGDIAIVWVRGILAKHKPWWDEIGDLALYEAQLVALMGRSDISTVVTVGHSPGGDAIAARDAALLVESLGERKRTVFFIDNHAYSAMYYIAAGHGEIYSTPTGGAGNIGTRASLVDESQAWVQAGLKKELFASGPLKALGEPGLSLTDEQRAFLEAHIVELDQPFRDFVTAHRNVDDQVFDGGWWAAPRAQELGLIDGSYLTLAHLVADLIDS